MEATQTCSERDEPLLTPKAARVRGLPSQGAKSTGTELYNSCKQKMLRIGPVLEIGLG